MSSSSSSWGLGTLELIVILAVIFAAIVLANRDRVRRIHLVRSLAIGLAVVVALVVAVAWVSFRSYQQLQVVSAEQQRRAAEERALHAQQRALRAQMDQERQDASRAPAAKPATAEPSSTSAPQARPGAPEPNGQPPGNETQRQSGRPDWVDKGSGPEGDGYRAVVTAGPHVTRLECEAELASAMRMAAKDYVALLLGEELAGSAQLSDDFIRTRVLKETAEEKIDSPTVGPMVQLHALLVFDSRTRDEVRRQAHETVVTGRVSVLGVAAGGLLLMMGAAMLLLRAGKGKAEPL